MTTFNTGKQRVDLNSIETMGVASLCSKRRLGQSDETDGVNADVGEYVPASKIIKKSLICEQYNSDHLNGTTHEKCSSEFLTTSILARSLLTTASTPIINLNSNGISSSSPLECLKSSLEALPAPMFLESIEELQTSSSFLNSSLPKVTTIRSDLNTVEDIEFNSLLCHERSTVTVLSPIDEEQSTNMNDVSSWETPSNNIQRIKKSISLNDEVITEEENGKSYFNLGPSETTILAKKSSSSSSSSTSSNSPPDQTWTNCTNNFDYLDDSSSSSSCESISSEDLFNSCEEYDDPSEDEEETRTYKQERSTVLHLSLCKLNAFRNQCVEPSLHRSVLICNTLRYIEQEIRREDEMKKNESAFSQRTENLPPFWSSNFKVHTGSSGGNTGNQMSPVIISSFNQNSSSNSSHDPYLSSSLYNNESPYSTTAYDYNSPHRPSLTPFHRTTYDYSETDIPNSITVSSQQQPTVLTGLVSSPSASLLECDSGYGEDLELSMSNYYYPTSSTPEFSSSSAVVTSSSIVPQRSNCYVQQSQITVDTTLPTSTAVFSHNSILVEESPCSNVTNETTSHCNVELAKDLLPSTSTTPNSTINCEISTTTTKVLNSSKDTIKDVLQLVGNDNLMNITENEQHQQTDGSKYKDANNLGISSSSTFTDPLESWSKFSSSMNSSFAQQENQCGMESLRSDYGHSNLKGHLVHPNRQLPMDSLVSPNYSVT